MKTTKTNAAQVTFGVEIECFVDPAKLITAGIRVGTYHNGIAVPGHDGWKAESDGSISPRLTDGCDGWQPVEFVSPKLKGQEGLDSVRRMCALLERIGARVNKSCGLHVHVGHPDNLKSLRRLIHLVANYEKSLYAVTGTKARETNHYSATMKEKLRHLAGKPESAIAADRVCRTDRYASLNLTNFLTRARSAVEFRAFAGTTSALKIAGYIQLCVGLVIKAIDGKAAFPWDGQKAETGATAGQTALERVLFALGWSNTKSLTVYGVIDEGSLADVIAEFRRLAVKYDAAR